MVRCTRRDPWPLALGRVWSTLFFFFFISLSLQIFVRVCTQHNVPYARNIPPVLLYYQPSRPPESGGAGVICERSLITIISLPSTRRQQRIIYETLSRPTENIYCDFMAARTSAGQLLQVNRLPVNCRNNNNNDNNKKKNHTKSLYY